MPQPPPTLVADAARWDAQVAADAAACDALRLELSSLAETDPDGEWFAGWADQVDAGKCDEVPPALRGHDVDFSDPVYASTPFAYRDAVPTTVPAPVPPPQSTTYKPRDLCPDIFPTALQARWEKWWPGVISDLRRYAESGGDAKREFNTPFIVALSELHPEAVGTVWDVRQRNRHGYYEPVDFSARLAQRPLGTPRSPSEVSTHLGVSFLEDEWADYDDQEMVPMVTRTGIDFLIDATDRQLVVFPHLVSLPSGFASVQKELNRLNGLKFNEFCSSFPFVPHQSLPQGATRRKYEDRDRRTTEGGAPRNDTVDADGNLVFPLNVAIGAKDIVGQTTWRLPNLPTTTGYLTYDEAVEAHASKPPPATTRWAPEVKVRVEDQLHNTAVLKYAAAVYEEPLFILTADAKDFFNQLMLAVWCRHHVGLFWLSLDAQHELYTFIVEHSLGFGISMASNIAQRFAYGLMYIFLRAFDDAEAPFLAADLRNKARRAWIKARRALSARTGRNECRLASALMYTDDPALLVVGVKRAVRLLRVWRWLTSRSGLIMAIAAKHAIGTRAPWLGFTHLPNLGAMVVPTDKLMRTLVTLRIVISGVALTVREYESLMGLLEHLLVWANGQRSSMYGLYAPLKRASAHGPSTPVNLKPSAIRSFEGWAERLKGRSGVAANAVFARSAFLRTAPSGLEATVYTDAAKDGTSRPGLGGYCHGLRFRVGLSKADVLGEFEIPIAVLEFIGIVVAILVFADHIASTADAMTIGSDSLTSVDAVLNDSSHADLMQLVHSFLLAQPEYALVRRILRLGHVYGEGNPWADAESRGHTDVLASLRSQLAIEPISPVVPKAALTLLDLVRAEVRGRPLRSDERQRGLEFGESRSLSANERANTKKRKSSTMGDGPGKFDHLFQPPTIPSACLGAFAVTAPAPSSVLSTAPPPVGVAVPLPPAPPRAPHTFDRFAHLFPTPSIPGAHSAQPAATATHEPRSVSIVPAGSITHSFTEVPNEARSKAAARIRLVTTAARQRTLTDVVKNDTSVYAIKPRDPASFDALLSDMGELLEESAPINTLVKDATAWKRWEVLCADFGTPAWRPSAESLSSDEVRRERFLFNAYNVKQYRVDCKPKRGNKFPKPSSALNNTLAVKRVLKRGGVTTVATPELTTLLKGMLRQYVRLHGPEALLPHRAEPFTNDDCMAVLQLTHVNGKELNWEHPFWCSFRAFITTGRAAAFRKADVLPVTKSEFDLASASRSNLTWYFQGKYRASLTPDELRSLTMADRAVIKPPPVKNDPFSESFGNHPIHLPWDGSDLLNAARWLADMELRFPVSDAERRKVPLFPSHSVTEPLTHGPADKAFRSVCTEALGEERAKQLTLHSMRIFAACSLLAQGASRPLIMALCRWKCEASLEIYARLRPEDYVHWVRRMGSARVTSITARNIPDVDNHALARAIDGLTV